MNDMIIPTSISTSQANQITAEIEQAAAEILTRHGLQPTSARYKPGHEYTFIIKAGFPLPDYQPAEVSPEEVRQAIAVKPDTVPPFNPDNVHELVGLPITAGGHDYTFVGYDTRQGDHPMLFQRVNNGQVYKFTTQSILLLVTARALQHATSCP